ncbi:MAG: uracil-DNA glycosylase [Desulfobulbaceae bacterium]
MSAKYSNIVEELDALLRFHQALGIDVYPRSEGIERFLAAEHVGEDRLGTAGGAESDRAGRQEELEALAGEIEQCARCPLSQDTRGRVPGTWIIGCRLLVVGDFSLQAGTISTDILFGGEEDAMLWKMMAAIGLSRDQVSVTNALKCCPADPEGIGADGENACAPFLEREVGALEPALICAMGETAARVLTGKKDPLARLRGRFLPCRFRTDRTIMVMPTFHPRFLLRHPEMKRATWNDLQAIEKRLKGK